MKVELLPFDPNFREGLVPQRIAFTPPSRAMSFFFQVQCPLDDEIDDLVEMVRAAKAGERQEQFFINHMCVYAEITPSVVRIHDGLGLGVEHTLELELPLDRFAEIARIWRDYGRDKTFVGAFEVR